MTESKEGNCRKRDIVFLYAAAMLPMISMLSLVHQYLFSSLTGTIVYGFLIPGLFGVAVYKGVWRRGRELQIMCIYWGWLLITRVINGDHALTESLDPMLSACQMILVFLPGFLLPEKERSRLLPVLAAGVSLFYLALGAASVYVGVTHRELINPLDGYWIGFVMKEMRIELLGLHPNIAGAHFMIAFCMSLYLLFRFRHPAVRIFAAVAAATDVVVIAQTVSRNAQTCLCAAVGLAVGICIISKMNHPGKPLRIIVLCASALACALLFYQCFEPIRYGLWAIYSAEETEGSAQSANPASAEGERLVLQTLSSGNPGYGQTALSSAGTQTHNAEESFRRDDRSYLESGRKEIYWSALKSLQMEPRRLLLGSSWEHLMDCSHELIREQVVHFHNDFLQALNLVGLPGFALLLLFFFFMAKTGFTILLDAGNRFALCEKMLVVPVAVFFIYVMLECVLTREYLDFRSLMFYLLCGFMTGTAKRQ